MRIPGVAVALVEVNAYVEFPGCNDPRPPSMSGLASSAAEDATAKVTGTSELPENVTDVPACTNALFAGLSDPSSESRFASLALPQIVPGGVGTYPCAELTDPTTTEASVVSATNQPTVNRLMLTLKILSNAKYDRW
jgi:hypothetical protein